jgi:ABC-2 type transport system ATP-binding protein
VLAIQAVGLTKVYTSFFGKSRQTALAGLDLTIPRGTAFGLIGLNGAGKTTFIKSILGVVRPTSGRVRALDGDPEDAAIRARIGYLPERLHLPNAWTPVAFLASVARLKGLESAGEAIRRQLDRVGLADDSSRRIGGFSKGMRQRLGLAAALLGAPDLLVLDEPTDGVDPLGRAEIRRILAEERARGATIFLNSHLLAETERVCDRIGILARGRLVREGAIEELTGSATRWRARFAPGADAAALAAIGFTAKGSDGVHVCDAEDPAALDALLARARGAGALLVELRRDLRDLEEVLSEALGSPALAGGSAS